MATPAAQPVLEYAGTTEQEPHIRADSPTTDLEKTSSTHVADEPVGRVLTRSSSHSPELPTWKFVLILVALCLTVLCMALDNTILAPAIPAISNAFHSLEDIGWYGSSYLVTLCAFPLLYGKLYGFFRLKWVFLSAIAIFEIGSLICAVAPNSTTLIVGRAIAGIGAAGIFQGAILIIAALVPLDKRPIYTGLIAGMYGIAGVVGPLLGGAFTDKVSWRWCFYINLPFGAVAVAFILLFLKVAPTHKYRGMRTFLTEIDIPGGIICFLPAVICLLLVLQWGGTTYAWSNGRIIGLLVVFAVLIISFIIIQIVSGENATVPMRVFKDRNIWGAALFSFGLGASFFVLVFYLATWFQAIKGVSAVKSAIMNLPLILSMTIVIIVAGGAVSAIGYYVPFMLASSVFMTVGAGLITTWKTNTGHPMWIGYQAIYGIGVGLGMQQTPIVVQTVLAEADISVGTAVILFAQTFGGALSVGIAQNIFTNELVKRLQPILPTDLDPRVILSIGATELRRLPQIFPQIPQAALPGILEAYNFALTRAFFVSVATAALSIFGAVFVQWRNIKTKPKEKKSVTHSKASSDIEKHPSPEVDVPPAKETSILSI